jgi:8-oxo-dGTP pyrophosphatase MutT (NUDIX family)
MTEDEKQKIGQIKHSVTAIILNDKNQVLGVSRKDDHEDFGLVGGKVDKEDISLETAIAREVMEETGLTINTDTMVQILSMHKVMSNGYMGHTYVIRDWSGEIDTNEPHVVKWLTFADLELGSFGDWNRIAKESLQSIGVDVI